MELLRNCTPAKDIDNRAQYKANDVKTCIDSSESISYLQNLVPKMARVFNNTDASHSAKKSGLRTVQAKLSLLNSALHATYELKFKAMNKHSRHYHLVGSFDNNDSPELPPYQTGKEIYWKNGKNTQYSYSKLSSDELLMGNHLGGKQTKDIPSSNINTAPIAEEIQDLFDMC